MIWISKIQIRTKINGKQAMKCQSCTNHLLRLLLLLRVAFFLTNQLKKIFVKINLNLTFTRDIWTIKDYPIVSIEDWFEQDDWVNWTKGLSAVNIQIVGDDLTVTNPKRIEMAVSKKACNCLLLKVCFDNLFQHNFT